MATGQKAQGNLPCKKKHHLSPPPRHHTHHSPLTHLTLYTVIDGARNLSSVTSSTLLRLLDAHQRQISVVVAARIARQNERTIRSGLAHKFAFVVKTRITVRAEPKRELYALLVTLLFREVHERGVEYGGSVVLRDHSIPVPVIVPPVLLRLRLLLIVVLIPARRKWFIVFTTLPPPQRLLYRRRRRRLRRRLRRHRRHFVRCICQGTTNRIK